MSENRIKQEDLDQIKSIRQDSLEIASILGELEFQKISIELKIEEQRQAIKTLKSKEASVFDDLKVKYGNVVINIETGEIS